MDAEDASYKYNGYTIEGRKLRIDWDVGIDRKEHLKPPRSPMRRDYPPGSPRDRPTSDSPVRRRDYPSPGPGADDYRRERSPGPY